MKNLRRPVSYFDDVLQSLEISFKKILLKVIFKIELAIHERITTEFQVTTRLRFSISLLLYS